MKKSKKHYKQRFNDFCAEVWLGIHTTPQRARALRNSMHDAIMNPLEDTSKTKKTEGISDDLNAQLNAETQKIRRSKPLKSVEA